MLRLKRLTLLLLAAAVVAPAGGRADTSDRVSIFYYPWYGTPALDGRYEHWQQGGVRPPFDIASNFYPARGAYSSSDVAVVNAQMDEIAAAGIGGVISSWWGRGSPEDARLPAVLRAARAHGLTLAVQLEPYAGRTVAGTEADIGYLSGLGIRSFYVYRSDDLPAAEWAALNDRLTDVRVFAQTGLIGHAAAGHFDGVYTYDILVYGGSTFERLCRQARAAGLLCSPSVGPGYEASRATGDPRVKPRLDGATYDAMWRAALHANADLITITSYNEWHEGTQIEPARVEPLRGEARYESYTGAYRLTGVAAARAYLGRTAMWAGLLRLGAGISRGLQRADAGT